MRSVAKILLLAFITLLLQHSPVWALNYPVLQKGSTVDTYQAPSGSVQVADPYRSLEDSELQSTKTWLKSEISLSQNYLDHLTNKKSLIQQISRLQEFAEVGLPVKRGGLYFFTKRNPKQNQACLYKVDKIGGNPELLFDPNPLSPDSTTAISPFTLSPKGNFLAISLQEKGTDWRSVRILNKEGQMLPETVIDNKYAAPVAWKEDESGFYYLKYKHNPSLDKPSLDSEVYFHKLNTAINQDTLVYKNSAHPDWERNLYITENGKRLILAENESYTNDHILVKDLTTAGTDFVEIAPLQNKLFAYAGAHGTDLFFNTNDTSGNGRVIKIPTSPLSSYAQSGTKKWTEVVASGSFAIHDAHILHQHLLVSFLQDAHTQVKVYDLHGLLQRSIDFPEKYVTASGFSRVSEQGETFYSYSSYTTPRANYQYDLESGKSTLFSKADSTFEADKFETTQYFFRSKDGTRVPLFLTYRKGAKFDGKIKVLMTGYGGFNISVTPEYFPLAAAWLERGGAFAVVNLRGGSEYGDAWHLAGTKLNKQNVFDDFISAAEFLIENKITSSSKLTVIGGSNGGLLIGAVLEQRPELFAVAVPRVGVMDMLRFNKFTEGPQWTDDYGSPEPLPDHPHNWDPREFETLLRISPYHQALAQKGHHISYPATLIMTSDHDDRVVPLHSYKFTAALQEVQSGPAPVLLRVETNAGHGSGLPLAKQIEQLADIIGFAENAIDK